MIFVTGDTHIPYDIHKLNTRKFSSQKNLTKSDYLIICGDFGAIWSENNKSDLYWIKWLTNKNFTTLFVDGNHENFDLLNAYPISKWKGGKVHFINNSIIHLMRGQIYNIDGFSFFTMGGGASGDKKYRIEGKSWWSQEMPCDEEYIEANSNLLLYNNKVDFIITHTQSHELTKEFRVREDEHELNIYFDGIRNEITYKKWYFGHFHQDIDCTDKDIMVYNRIIQIV